MYYSRCMDDCPAHSSTNTNCIAAGPTGAVVRTVWQVSSQTVLKLITSTSHACEIKISPNIFLQTSFPWRKLSSFSPRAGHTNTLETERSYVHITLSENHPLASKMANQFNVDWDHTIFSG